MLFALNSCRSGSHFYRFFCDHLIVLEIVITALSVKGLSLHARPNYPQNRAQILYLKTMSPVLLSQHGTPKLKPFLC